MVRKYRRRRSRFHSIGRAPTRACGDYLALWMLRLHIVGGVFDIMMRRHDLPDAETLIAMGVEVGDEDTDEDEVDPDEIRAVMERRLGELEHTLSLDGGNLLRNVARVARYLGLDAGEEAILGFLTLEQIEQALENAITELRKAGGADASTMLATALGLSPDEVRTALQPEANLIASGLIERSNHPRTLDDGTGFQVLDSLADQLFEGEVTPERVFRGYFRISAPAQLTPADCPHLDWDLRILTTLLGKAAAAGQAGINVLIHGGPGVGKTEFARLVAQEAGLTAHEVNHCDSEGTALPPSERRNAYQLCQYLPQRDRRTVILFDEVEDLFDVMDMLMALTRRRSHGRGGKAWTNHMLESNPVPAIWITNHPGDLDAAYLRRFHYTVEMRQPPASVRERILTQACESLPVSEDWIHRTAREQDLTPTEITSSTDVAQLLREDMTAEGIEPLLNEHLRRQIRLQGRKPPRRRRGADAMPFRLDHLNATPAVEPVVRTLTRMGEGSLLLHGVPGTGKTALAHHIAEQADRPLISRPASSVMSPYVGMTEKNLARLFDEAHRKAPSC